MDCTRTLEVGGVEHKLHYDFDALKALATKHELSLVGAERGLLEFNVVVQSKVLLEGLEGGRRIDPASRPAPWKLADAEVLVRRYGVLEISKPLHEALLAAARPEEREEIPSGDSSGKAPTG